jgi:hypothetical protein
MMIELEHSLVANDQAIEAQDLEQAAQGNSGDPAQAPPSMTGLVSEHAGSPFSRRRL